MYTIQPRGSCGEGEKGYAVGLATITTPHGKVFAKTRTLYYREWGEGGGGGGFQPAQYRRAKAQ